MGQPASRCDLGFTPEGPRITTGSGLGMMGGMPTGPEYEAFLMNGRPPGNPPLIEVARGERGKGWPEFRGTQSSGACRGWPPGVCSAYIARVGSASGRRFFAGLFVALGIACLAVTLVGNT